MRRLRLGEVKCIAHIFAARKKKLHLSDEANAANYQAKWCWPVSFCCCWRTMHAWLLYPFLVSWYPRASYINTFSLARWSPHPLEWHRRPVRVHPTPFSLDSPSHTVCSCLPRLFSSSLNAPRQLCTWCCLGRWCPSPSSSPGWLLQILQNWEWVSPPFPFSELKTVKVLLPFTLGRSRSGASLQTSTITLHCSQPGLHHIKILWCWLVVQCLFHKLTAPSLLFSMSLSERTQK